MTAPSGGSAPMVIAEDNALTAWRIARMIPIPSFMITQSRIKLDRDSSNNWPGVLQVAATLAGHQSSVGDKEEENEGKSCFSAHAHSCKIAQCTRGPRKHSCESIMSGIGNVLPLGHSSLACAAKGSGTGAEEPSDVPFSPRIGLALGYKLYGRAGCRADSRSQLLGRIKANEIAVATA